ncbi:MAG TPA: DJ-1/PfpI family protein [Thermoanaerobaculia bacterium]|nr:DJ-1/PfpI family protein [Thermoanaerobaculia bacterium]
MKRVTIAGLLLFAAFALYGGDPKPYTRNVAIVVYENAEPLDWTGPFEVYNDAASFGAAGGQPAFNVYVVSKTTSPVNAQGMQVVPNYSIQNAPKPDIVVFPGGPSSKIYDDPEFFAWSKKAATEAEIAQSVCTGAFVLGKAGMLDNLEVTTFHGAIERLQKDFPAAKVEDGRRFVDNGHVVTTAGISAGIDGSLNVVARLLGRRTADQVATYMEYHWTPEAYLATKYSYLNPSTDDRGRTLQTAEIQFEQKDYTTAAKTLRALLAENPHYAYGWWDLGETLRELGQHADAANAFAKAGEDPKVHGADQALFSAAREYARADRNDDAVAMLQKAVDAGFKNRDAIRNSPELAKLKDDARVKAIAER